MELANFISQSQQIFGILAKPLKLGVLIARLLSFLIFGAQTIQFFLGIEG